MYVVPCYCIVNITCFCIMGQLADVTIPRRTDQIIMSCIATRCSDSLLNVMLISEDLVVTSEKQIV